MRKVKLPYVKICEIILSICVSAVAIGPGNTPSCGGGHRACKGQQTSGKEYFYLRDSLHSVVFAGVRCLSVCLSHVGIVSKRLNLS